MFSHRAGIAALILANKREIDMQAKINFNERLEIQFDSIPSPAIRAEMKKRGFTWDSRKMVWHLYRPVSVRFVRNEPVITDGVEYALQFCCDYLGLTAEDRANIKKKMDFASVQRAEQSMEESCGIA